MKHNRIPIAFIRRDDEELFTLNEDKITYSLQMMKDQFPNSLHMKYTEEQLKLLLPIYGEEEEMICKTCNKKFHHCTNCGYVQYMSYGYCSEICYKANEKYVSNIEDAKLLINSLTNKQLVQLYTIVTESFDELFIEDILDLIEWKLVGDDK